MLKHYTTNRSVSKHVLQVLSTLALCIATSLGVLARQTPAWMNNVKFSIEAGLISCPKTLKGTERDAFQAALKDALSASFIARGNFEDSLLYVFASGDRRVLLSILGRDSAEVNGADMPVAWDLRGLEDMVLYVPTPGDAEALSDLSSHASEATDIADMPVERDPRGLEDTVLYVPTPGDAEALSGISSHASEATVIADMPVEEDVEELHGTSSNSCNDPKAIANAFGRFMGTVSGKQRFKNVAKRMFADFQQRQLNKKEALARILTELINSEDYLVTQ